MVDVPADIREAWDCLEWARGLRESPGANNPDRVSRPGFHEDTLEGNGEVPIPGLPSAFLAYQINASGRTVNGGGRVGTDADSQRSKNSPSAPPRAPGA